MTLQKIDTGECISFVSKATVHSMRKNRVNLLGGANSNHFLSKRRIILQCEVNLILSRWCALSLMHGFPSSEQILQEKTLSILKRLGFEGFKDHKVSLKSGKA